MLLQRLIPALAYAVASLAVAALTLTLDWHTEQKASQIGTPVAAPTSPGVR